MSRSPGQPILFPKTATPKIDQMDFPMHGGHISIRNTGVNTLWLSFDKKEWFDIASGTSYDEDTDIRTLYYCTQTDKTTFVANWIPWH